MIEFPSAQVSKLSADPSTKIPSSTDWIFQDFFNAMLDYHSGIAIPPSAFPDEHDNLFFEELMAPVLIESDVSSDSSLSINTELFEQESVIANTSTSLFRSLNVFQMNKKQPRTVSKKKSNCIRKSLSRKLSKLFKS